nr:mitochondrial import inner membrane translocase [Hymenolepis microstoma]
MAKYLAQMILAGSRILGRAFAKALQEEYAASKNAARARVGASQSSSPPSETSSCASGISLEEAKQILNVSDIYNTEEVNKRYDHLFTVNDKKNGGSLYLQSKVFRAKERIDEELQAKPDNPSTSSH